MSRNFELLQKLGKEQELTHPTPADDSRKSPVAAPVAVPVSATTTGAPATAAALVNGGLEQVNALAHQLFIQPGADAPRAVVFTSTEPGTGCTWVCAHLAGVLAGRVAGSVCLVDANLRDPGLHQHFGVANESGLSDALLRLDPIRSLARSVTLPNLWLISAGADGESAQALLTSDRMRLRLTELRKEFDFVLVDASAMSVSSDAVALGSASDGVIMVLKANASRRQTARQAIGDLQGGQAKVLGAVLNQRTFPIPEAVYKRL
ncbi:MAG TPA: CpsD/CapB family tyrosine-protein kinase [Terriglobales bacterium]|jgi:Mrp family chromosome partitioning ATPase|nr:CpsD/CapB family tyrosine-protein kinase [Terriglobales bacterium]